MTIVKPREPPVGAGDDSALSNLEVDEVVQSLAQDNQERRSEEPAHDIPPPYMNQAPMSASASASSLHPRQEQMMRKPNVPPTNFLTIKRDKAAIREACIIDPGLRLPPSSLFDSSVYTDKVLEAEGEVERAVVRKNLLVEAKNGNVNVDIWLVDEAGEVDGEVDGEVGIDDEFPATLGRAELDVSSKNGSVTVRLNSSTLVPYALSASCNYGAVTISIPSSFSGPVLLSAGKGTIAFSPGVLTRTVTFSDIDGRRSCFIGDVRTFSGRETWTGSTIDASSNTGRVKLSFVDEGPTACGDKGFWGKLFQGWWFTRFYTVS